MRCFNNEASEEEQLVALEWILASVRNKASYENLRDAWVAEKLSRPVDHGQQKRSWQKVVQRISVPTASLARKRERPRDVLRVMPKRWTQMAAAVFLAFALGTIVSGILSGFFSVPADEDFFYTVEAPRGAKSTLTMIDGSTIYLNAGSKARYSRAYNTQNRDIYLEGEGYFIVARNGNIPFEVHTSGIIIKALGTEFNVKAYPEDGRVETTLVKGSVSIARSDDGSHAQSIILKPNQKASFFIDRIEVNEVAEQREEKSSPQLTAISRPVRVKTESNINPETSASWKDARWVLERESMASLSEKLERQYDINIIFMDEELKRYHLTGTLEEESIEQVLKALQLALPIDFEIRHKDVTLSLNRQRKNNFKHLLK